MRVATEPLGDALRRMSRLTGLQSALSLTDAQLLERFVNQRDEPAFAALMVRHGPMVLCLCRQMLRDAQEAEDAFQASFLVLARNAASIRKAAVVECVAVRRRLSCGGASPRRSAKRRTREAAGFDLSTLPSSTEPANPDLQPVLHEEIRRLPLKYRAPVVLCYLESKTNEEAAHQLAWPVGTVKARLSRARDMLRLRLARRGMGGALSTRYTASIMPIFLLDSTLRAAMRLATGGGAVKAVAGAVHLAKLKLTTAAVLAACLLGAGTTSLPLLAPTPDKTGCEARQSIASPVQKSDIAAAIDATDEIALPDAAPAPPAEQHPPAEWQAHPFPQTPTQPNGGMETPDCMES